MPTSAVRLARAVTVFFHDRGMRAIEISITPMTPVMIAPIAPTVSFSPSRMKPKIAA
ncbi:hypothetical protein D3C87_1887800 [compost metagenome]